MATTPWRARPILLRTLPMPARDPGRRPLMGQPADATRPMLTGRCQPAGATGGGAGIAIL